MFLIIQPTPTHLIAFLTITGQIRMEGGYKLAIILIIKTHTIAFFKIIRHYMVVQSISIAIHT